MAGALDVDLVVVGTGPAGSAAAITATRAGRRVVALDATSFPRDKICGDGLTAGALRALEALGLDVPTDAAYEPVHEVVLVSPSGRRVRAPLPADAHHAGVMTRARLDAALVAMARDDGVDLREGCKVDRVRPHADHVVVGAGDLELRARWVVAADGHYSTVRRLLRPEARPAVGEWSAFRQYWRGVADRRLWVLFDARLLPGYAWVFPLPDGRANVGITVLRGPGVTGAVVAQRWRETLASTALREVLGPDAAPEHPHRAWPIPTRYDPRSLAWGRTLFVGDAASVVDPMTGEGIAQALESGILAAASIVAGGDAVDVVDRYRRDVHRRIGRDLRFAQRLQRLLRSPRATRGILRTVDLTPWTRRNFARWMFEDYPRAVVLTPDRWHRRMLAPPGSFPDVPLAAG